MRVREWINNNSVITTVVAAVLLVVALSVVAMQLRGPTYQPTEVYFWDLGTEEPFVLTSDQTPPVEAPSGDRGVRAHLYTCGECTPDEWFGYLETLTKEAKQAQMSEDVLPEEEDRLVRALDGERWVPYFSEQGMAIQDRVYASNCGDAETLPEQCLPTDE
ncbi:MAG: hypothetical protein ACODAQ_04960 [Phycisphaeraceae bacterium]